MISSTLIAERALPKLNSGTLHTRNVQEICDDSLQSFHLTADR
jgi:hypothetical protein